MATDVKSDVNGRRTGGLVPDLTRLVVAWPALLEATRRDIMALVEAALPPPADSADDDPAGEGAAP